MQLAFSGDGFTRIDCLRPFPSLTPVLFSPLFPCVLDLCTVSGGFERSSASELTFNKADDEVIGRAIAIKIFSNSILPLCTGVVIIALD
ncbi:predicted protein [Arabidopsis lyrata subsp. lyrata]|uniref:Predicted protein n=1 Tax=Arabidopsis lyrata subsp. lyrata TaxID=81972 RepID=D7LB48_ARALL|nr:predicted protein [Arabidopsis lyrata subsp. lyrata]